MPNTDPRQLGSLDPPDRVSNDTFRPAGAQSMYELLQIATAELLGFLNKNLAGSSPNWWQDKVIQELTFQQQRIAEERCHRRLEQLDLAALLRVTDRNWDELAYNLKLTKESRNWLKELQTVRNRWAHISAERIADADIYRDADTLERFLKSISASPPSLRAVEKTKNSVFASIASSVGKDEPMNQEKRIPAPNSGDKTTTPAVDLQPTTTMFVIGELVALRSDPKVVVPVIEVITGGAEVRYRVFQNRTKAIYYESQLQACPKASGPHNALTAEQMRAHLTSLQLLAPSTANLFSLRSGRIKFVPYQYRPVLKLVRADRPRLLIADEVGVGKTIEAGLIIRELRARMDVSSILVICPKALVAEHKWTAEMKRFDEQFTTLDGPLLRHCLRETHLEGEWPQQYSTAILPFSLFDSELVTGLNERTQKKSEGLLELDPPPRFDLVVVDEAHHIRNTETFAHQATRYFCDNAQAVVLLTATPVQLGSDDLFTLLNVLRPDLVIDHASFEKMAEPNAYINEAVKHCRARQPGWQKAAQHALSQAVETEWGRLFVREAPSFQNIYDKLQNEDVTDQERVSIIRSIEELYTFSPIINRTRRRDIGNFTTRKPETYPIEFTPSQSKLHDGLLDVIAKILGRCHGQQNVKFMMTTIRRQAASCLYGLAPLLSDILKGKLDRLELLEASDSDSDGDFGFVEQIRSEIEQLLTDAIHLDPEDPKVTAFIQILVDKDKQPKNKALVFSTFRHTLAYLDNHARRAGLRVGLVHGDVPDDERAQLRRRFALPKQHEDAIDVLLSSEVGCEGLDFQFCDLLINYDLPWNPMRIEQRIGRIDRYGQESEAVAIVNFITPGTVDADIYERCLWRIGVFQHAVGGSEEILGVITREIHDIAESFNLGGEERAQRLQQLADNEILRIREEAELESKQAELFGLNLPDAKWKEDIKAAETFWLSAPAIEHTVRVYLIERLAQSTDHILGDRPLKTLRLNQEARNLLLEDYRKLPRSTEATARQWEKWLKGDQPTLSITFEQESAVENPKGVHLSVVHPLVRQAARYLEVTEPKYFALTARSPDVPAGMYHFALYSWARLGVKSDESLVAVADNPILEERIFSLLETAANDTSLLPSEEECNALDARHHQKWSEARANHVAENRQIVENRIHSLTVSHRARCRAIEDQITRATNDKIRLMKQSELARANSDFDRRMSELQQAANTGDIRTSPVVFGTITLTKDIPK